MIFNNHTINDDKKISFLKSVVTGYALKMIDSLHQGYQNFGSLTEKQRSLLDTLYQQHKHKSLKKPKELESKKREESTCLDCGDSGNLFAERYTGKWIGYGGVFRCHCSIGSSRPFGQGTQWDSSFESEWRKKPIHA